MQGLTRSNGYTGTLGREHNWSPSTPVQRVLSNSSASFRCSCSFRRCSTCCLHKWRHCGCLRAYVIQQKTCCHLCPGCCQRNLATPDFPLHCGGVSNRLEEGAACVHCSVQTHRPKCANENDVTKIVGINSWDLDKLHPCCHRPRHQGLSSSWPSSPGKLSHVQPLPIPRQGILTPSTPVPWEVVAAKYPS